MPANNHWVAFVVEQDVLFDPILIRFFCPVSIILQPQSVADLIKEPVFGGSMDPLLINRYSNIINNVH